MTPWYQVVLCLVLVALMIHDAAALVRRAWHGHPPGYVHLFVAAWFTLCVIVAEWRP